MHDRIRGVANNRTKSCTSFAVMHARICEEAVSTVLCVHCCPFHLYNSSTLRANVAPMQGSTVARKGQHLSIALYHRCNLCTSAGCKSCTRGTTTLHCNAPCVQVLNQCRFQSLHVGYDICIHYTLH